MSNQDQEADVLGEDILDGVRKIAEYLGQDEKKTGYQIRAGYWDGAVFRVGKLIKARKSELARRASGASGSRPATDTAA
jgi:hypothetical protein